MIDLVITLCFVFLFVASIGFSYRAGFNANEKYHQQIKIAERNAVNDYRAKEQALFNMSQQEADFYKRAIVQPIDNEIPLSNYSNVRRYQDDKHSAFVGKKSEF